MRGKEGGVDRDPLVSRQNRVKTCVMYVFTVIRYTLEGTERRNYSVQKFQVGSTPHSVPEKEEE